jgi:hypothetical protein
LKQSALGSPPAAPRRCSPSPIRRETLRRARHDPGRWPGDGGQGDRGHTDATLDRALGQGAGLAYPREKHRAPNLVRRSFAEPNRTLIRVQPIPPPRRQGDSGAASFTRRYDGVAMEGFSPPSDSSEAITTPEIRELRRPLEPKCQEGEDYERRSRNRTFSRGVAPARRW